MLLIITNRDDFTADYVILGLREKDVPYIRFNTDEFPQQCKISRSFESNYLSGNLKKFNNKTNLENVSVVWYRRSLNPPPITIFGVENSLFVQQEIRHFLEGTLLSLQVPWVNPLPAVMSSERKIFQLSIALDCGLTIPETIITNDPLEINAFANKHENIICKPIYSGLQITENKGYSVYTHEINREYLKDYKAIKNCPTLYQRRIEKEVDIRLTFFGDNYFPVQIKGINEEVYLDWRKPEYKLLYELTKIPNDIINSCKIMLSRLGLVYGAFDLIRDRAGKYYFLEVNPAGEWAWLDRELQLGMREALISLFETQKGSSKWLK
ncbi:hypothetical protein H1S01_19350 [Heliobacterium chlorum]|uniref:MvdD-like pre-ATP grasp domain-containing protein n=1 Tax=Heliobacterium chlorum TaxID=2698 RepID=A0ABR7T762_HELCL|nr:hypothetical protein [Heliobacterium chlorum]MBC9786604.1 hypothetical protein [Heliobacterium chlorum]